MANGPRDSEKELAELEQLLDIYGAERTRWPAPARLRFASLLAQDAAARKRFDQASALDQLLDAAAPTGDARHEALASRIVAAAAAEGRASNPSTPMGRRSFARAIFQARPSQVSSTWPVVLAMAASFALGVVLGTRGLGDVLHDPLVQASDVSGAEDTDETVLALGTETGDVFEEGL